MEQLIHFGARIINHLSLLPYTLSKLCAFKLTWLVQSPVYMYVTAGFRYVPSTVI
jgi:hypothetical protein